MPTIEIRFEEEQYRPYLLCDECSIALTAPGWGLVLWLPDAAGGVPPGHGPFFTHKGGCTRAFEEGHADLGGPNPRWYSEELDVFLAQLGNNAGARWDWLQAAGLLPGVAASAPPGRGPT